MDQITLHAAQRGDRDALASLLHCLQDSWYRMSLGLLADPELARDATQETAIRFLRQLPGFRGESQLRTWSLGICINVVREIKRASRFHGSLDGVEDHPPASDTLGGPEADAQRAEEIEALRAVLHTLPDRQREAVVLRFFEDLSVEQTAAAMKCAAGTVKATVHQALRALRTKLKLLV